MVENQNNQITTASLKKSTVERVRQTYPNLVGLDKKMNKLMDEIEELLNKN